VTKLLGTGFEPTAMSEQAVRDTARVLISEIGL